MQQQNSIIETALRGARARLLNEQAITSTGLLADIDLALGALNGCTRSLLLTHYGRPDISLRKHSEELLGHGYKTTLNRISARTLPLPAFRQGSGWAVHINDLAAHIDSLATQARTEFLNRIRGTENPAETEPDSSN